MASWPEIARSGTVNATPHAEPAAAPTSAKPQYDKKPEDATHVKGARADEKVARCLKAPKVVSFADLAEEHVNHPPYTNKKRVFARIGEVPTVTQIGVADFGSGTGFPLHKHRDMFEIFYVLGGEGEFTVTDENEGSADFGQERKVKATKGTFLHLPPGVAHSGRATSAGWGGAVNFQLGVHLAPTFLVGRSSACGWIRALVFIKSP